MKTKSRKKLFTTTYRWRADKMENGLLRAIKHDYPKLYQKMMAVIKKFEPKRVTIGFNGHLKPVNYSLDI